MSMHPRESSGIIEMFEGKTFKFGKRDYKKAQLAAIICAVFKEDDEDEWVDSEICSCYNCRYRRWTETSFHCMKKS